MAVPIGKVVREYKIENTTIKICDDAYRDKTPADIDRILKRIVAIGWECVQSARKAGRVV
jgi:hypothetical protein